MAGRQAAARITVTDELKFWYYQEFGTATHAERGTDHPDGYTIDPVNAEALRLPMTSGHPDALLVPHVGPPNTVLHPGVEPKHMVTRVIDEIREATSALVVAAMQEGSYTFEPVHQAVLKSASDAKEVITASFEEQLPGERTDPQGQKLATSAAEAFADDAEIVDLSS